jgi:hypothetical protein
MKATIRSDFGFVRVREKARVDAREIGVLINGRTLEVDHLVDGDGGKWAALRAGAGGAPLVDEAGQALYWYVYGIYLQIGVPWISQVTNTLRLDCGPACWTMLARWCGVQTSIEALAKAAGAENRLTDAEDALTAWRSVGLNAEMGAQIVDPPFLCLVNYLDLPERYDKTYTGQHLVVVTGVEKSGEWVTGVRFHDPLWATEAQGADKLISVDQFHRAEANLAQRARCWPK